MAKQMGSKLNCVACGEIHVVECSYQKPTFMQRRLVSGTCNACGSLSRYSVYMVEGGKIRADFVECEMSLAGKAKYYLRKEKEVQNVQSERTENT